MRLAIVLPHLELFGGVRRMIEFGNRLNAMGTEVQILLDEHSSPRCTWMRVDPPVRVLPDGLRDPFDVAMHVDERQWWVLQSMPNVDRRIFYALHDGVLYDKAGAFESAVADVDAILANSRWTAERIALRCGHNPIVVLGGIDRSVFSPRHVARSRELLCSGDARPWKGTEELRRVADRAEMSLTEMRRVQARQHALADLISSAEMFLVGSEHEGFGQPGLEALACGTPLVTTDNGGCREYAENGVTALVVPYGDEDAMVRAITRLRRDDGLRQTIRANGLRMVESRFSWGQRTAEFAAILDRIFEGTTTVQGNRVAQVEDPDLSIVVLAWDQLHHTQACVESIRRHTDVPYELIVVDNGSAWDARAYASAAADQAVLHDDNLGFSGGMDAGLEVARGNVVAFANNDTVMPPGWASPLLQTLRSQPRIGIVAPAVTEARNTRTVRATPQDVVEVLDPFEPPPAAVLWLMPTELARGLGGFDRHFHPAAGEDVDLAFKVWVNDLDIVFDQRVLIQHVGKGTAATKLPNWRATWRHNGDRLLQRWTSPDLDVPRLDDVDQDRFNRNLRTAAAVAGWMQRYFTVRERRFPGKHFFEAVMVGLDKLKRDPLLRHRAAVVRDRLRPRSR